MPLSDAQPIYIRSLAEIEAEAIRNTLIYANGSPSLASKYLGIGRSTLYRKISDYDLWSVTFDARNSQESLDFDNHKGAKFILATKETTPLKERFPPGTFGSPECNAALAEMIRQDRKLNNSR